MAPKRTTKAAAARPAAIDRDTDEAVAQVTKDFDGGATLVSTAGRLPALPPKYSTNYGSPPVILNAGRRTHRQPTNVAAALDEVLDLIERDNKEDDAKFESRSREEGKKRKSERARSTPFDDEPVDMVRPPGALAAETPVRSHRTSARQGVLVALPFCWALM